MWLLTVPSLTTRRSAISLFESPAAISSSTSASRAVIPSGRSGGRGGGPARAAGGDGIDEVMLDGRVDDGLVLENLEERLADLLPAGVLGEIPAGTRPERIEHRPVVGVGGQDHHLRRGSRWRS